MRCSATPSGSSSTTSEHPGDSALDALKAAGDRLAELHGEPHPIVCTARELERIAHEESWENRQQAAAWIRQAVEFRQRQRGARGDR